MKGNNDEIPTSGVQLVVSYLMELRTRRKKRRKSCLLLDAAIKAVNASILDSALRILEKMKYCEPLSGSELALLEEAERLLRTLPKNRRNESLEFKIARYLGRFLVGRLTLNAWLMIQNNIQLFLISLTPLCGLENSNSKALAT